MLHKLGTLWNMYVDFCLFLGGHLNFLDEQEKRITPSGSKSVEVLYGHILHIWVLVSLYPCPNSWQPE